MMAQKSDKPVPPTMKERRMLSSQYAGFKTDATSTRYIGLTVIPTIFRSQSSTLSPRVCEDDGTPFHRDLPLERDATIRYACAMYSVQCLLEILKLSKAKTVMDRLKVTLEYATGYPLLLSIPLTAHSQIRVLLAPRGYEEEASEVAKSLSALWGFLCTPLFFSQPQEGSA
jgi:hypothetical protein